MIVNTALTTDLHEKLKYRNIETYVKAFHSETVELDSKLSNAYKMSAIANTENFESENAYQSEVRALPVENEVVLPTIENAVSEQENDGAESVDQFGDFFDSTIVDVLGQSEEDSEDLIFDDEMEDEESSETSEYTEEEVQPVEEVEEVTQTVQENENSWFMFGNVLTCQVTITDLPQEENPTEDSIILGDDEEIFEDEEEIQEEVEESENSWFMFNSVLTCQVTVTDLPQEENPTEEGIILDDEEEIYEDEEVVVYEDGEEEVYEEEPVEMISDEEEEESDGLILGDETEEEDLDNPVSNEETKTETNEHSLLIVDSFFRYQVTVEDVIEDETFEEEEEYSEEEDIIIEEEEEYSEEDEEDVIFEEGEEYSEEEGEEYSDEEEVILDEEEEINLVEEEEYSEEEEEEISFEDEEIIMGNGSEDTENSFEDEDLIVGEEETVSTPIVPNVDIPIVPQVTAPVVPNVDIPVVPQVTAPVVSPVVPQVTPIEQTVSTPVVPPVDIPVVPQVTQPVVPQVTQPVVPQVTPIEQAQGSEETDSLLNIQDSDLDDDELLFSDTTQQEEVEVKPKEVPKKKKKKAPTKAEVPSKPKVADTKEIRAFIKERGSVTIEELFKHFDKKSINKAELSGKITKRNGKYKA